MEIPNTRTVKNFVRVILRLVSQFASPVQPESYVKSKIKVFFFYTCRSFHVAPMKQVDFVRSVYKKMLRRPGTGIFILNFTGEAEDKNSKTADRKAKLPIKVITFSAQEIEMKMCTSVFIGWPSCI